MKQVTTNFYPSCYHRAFLKEQIFPLHTGQKKVLSFLPLQITCFQKASHFCLAVFHNLYLFNFICISLLQYTISFIRISLNLSLPLYICDAVFLTKTSLLVIRLYSSVLITRTQYSTQDLLLV